MEKSVGVQVPPSTPYLRLRNESFLICLIGEGLICQLININVLIVKQFAMQNSFDKMNQNFYHSEFVSES